MLNKLATLPHKKNINFDIDFRLRLYIFFLYIRSNGAKSNERVESSVFTLLWHGKLYTEKKSSERNSGKKKIISDYSSVLLREESRMYIHIYVFATAAAIK